MKAFLVTGADGKPFAATLDEGMAMDLLFDNALSSGIVDDGTGVIDLTESTVTETDTETLLEAGTLTRTEVGELEEHGAVLI